MQKMLEALTALEVTCVKEDDAGIQNRLQIHKAPEG